MGNRPIWREPSHRGNGLKFRGGSPFSKLRVGISSFSMGRPVSVWRDIGNTTPHTPALPISPDMPTEQPACPPTYLYIYLSPDQSTNRPVDLSTNRPTCCSPVSTYRPIETNRTAVMEGLYPPLQKNNKLFSIIFYLCNLLIHNDIHHIFAIITCQMKKNFRTKCNIFKQIAL